MYWRAAFPAVFLLSLTSCSEPNTGGERHANPDDFVDESPKLVLSPAVSPNEALRHLPVSVGDRVRIVTSPVGDELQISGMTAEVIEVRDSGSTAAIAVDGQDWKITISSSLLEPIDPPAGLEISMGDRTWVSNQDGEWVEVGPDN